VKISLVVNPSSADAVEELRQGVAALREGGHLVKPRLTFERRDARRFAAEDARDGMDLLIAGGGDGTVSEVAAGLLDYLTEAGGSDRRAPRLGIVPLGTGNDFACAQGIPETPSDALATAVISPGRPVDIGLVNGRAFVNVSTGGFGAEATEDTGEAAKRVLGPLAYVVTGVQKFATLDPTEARFTADDGEVLYEGCFLLFAVGNSRRTGGGNWLTPRAELDDGLLDICIVRDIPRIELLALAPALRTGAHVSDPAVIYRQVRTLRVDAECELSVNADGEPLDGCSFVYELSPYRLEMALPE
jgi:lipid kinase YegS